MVSDLEKYIYAKIDAMQTEKAKQHVHPNMVTREELMTAINSDVKTVLNKMYIEKNIKVHQTIHSKNYDYVELVKK